jgi:hypothetical protein
MRFLVVPSTSLVLKLVKYAQKVNNVYRVKQSFVIGIIQTTHVKTHKFLQVCKQVVTNLFTSCQQVVFTLLVNAYYTLSKIFIKSAFKIKYYAYADAFRCIYRRSLPTR